jgi:ABC-2 type transport system ATP-binding protein
VQPALEFSAVSKAFGDVQAIDGLELDVPVGSVTVILGPNGAGKTTTIRLSTGVFAADRGSVRTFGLDPREFGAEVRARTGVVPPKPAMYERLSGLDNLRYAAKLYGLTNPPIFDLADRFGILHALGHDVAGYSTGMRTRLALARSLLHDPELLLLDEPTAGLDPESAYSVRELIFEMAKAGKTVVMSTHLLHEADGTADQIVMMNGGSAWEKGSPRDLIARYWQRLEVRLESEDHAALLAAVRDMAPRVDELQAVTVSLNDSSEIPALIGRLVAGGIPLTRVEPVTPTLERLYFAMRKQVGTAAPRLDPGESS